MNYHSCPTLIVLATVAAMLLPQMVSSSAWSEKFFEKGGDATLIAEREAAAAASTMLEDDGRERVRDVTLTKDQYVEMYSQYDVMPGAIYDVPNCQEE